MKRSNIREKDRQARLRGRVVEDFGARHAVDVTWMRPALDHLLREYGYAAVFVVIALENLGVPLPGETILLASAIFAATTHELNVVGIVITAAGAAFGGGVAGLLIGRYGERHVLQRFGRYLHLDERDLRLGRYLFQRFGGRSSSWRASSRFFARWPVCSRVRTR